jgi:hypothetical protein
MSKWLYYDRATGLLTGRTLQGPAEWVGRNTPPGCAALQVDLAVVADPKNRRVNLATGELEPYRPDPPPDDELRTWEWDDQAERYRPMATEAALKLQRGRELQLLLEARERAQDRPQRELLLALAEGKAPPAEAVAKLAEIEADVVELRDQIRATAR